MGLMEELQEIVNSVGSWLAAHHGTRKFLYFIGYNIVGYLVANWTTVIGILPDDVKVQFAVILSGIALVLTNWYSHLPKPEDTPGKKAVKK